MNAFRGIVRTIYPSVRVVVNRRIPAFSLPVRYLGATAAPASSDDVVIPELVTSLEWALETPLSVHQFEEPPIIVEIEHLDNLIVADH